MLSVILSSSFVSSPHFSLTAFFINNLLLLYFAVVLHSPTTISRYLLTQSSHRILGLHLRLFPFAFCASALSVNWSSPIVVAKTEMKRSTAARHPDGVDTALSYDLGFFLIPYICSKPDMFVLSVVLDVATYRALL